MIMMISLGILLPATFLSTPVFQFLAAFVALNTIMYVVLSIAKMLPKLYLSDWVRRRKRRAETRNINPDEPFSG